MASGRAKPVSVRNLTKKTNKLLTFFKPLIMMLRKNPTICDTLYLTSFSIWNIMSYFQEKSCGLDRDGYAKPSGSGIIGGEGGE